MTSDEWKEANSLYFKRQYITLDGTRFFGPPGSTDAWNRRADFPLRYFLWQTNGSAWDDLDWFGLSEATVQACAAELVKELDALNLEIAEYETEDPDNEFPRTLVETRIKELDADEMLIEYLEEELLESLGEEIGIPLEADMLTTMLALMHVSDGVKCLERNDLAMAGAYAIKAQSWLLTGRHARGRSTFERVRKQQLATSGSDATHAENRRLRKLAIERYNAGTWPSKMEAARKISAEVNRTEMVVMRWIREDLRAK